MTAVDDHALGQFLQARRALVEPEALGLVRSARRRVAGLRREEVALVAGISLDYYVRLERGRDRHPSGLVVDALARTLQLDDAATAHLHDLARAAPAPAPPAAAEREVVGAGALQLLEALEHQPALVHGRTMDVLAANPLAVALNPGFAAGTNLLRFIFLDPGAREHYADWAQVADDAVAGLRGTAGLSLGEPGVRGLVDELMDGSEAFRRRWARHDVHGKTAGEKRFHRPDGTVLALSFDAFDVAASPGQALVVYRALPGSSEHAVLMRLADELAAVR